MKQSMVLLGGGVMVRGRHLHGSHDMCSRVLIKGMAREEERRLSVHTYSVLVLHRQVD